jgi:D-2-hydroxyacid dehydrogenase (NADP+)
VTITPPSRQPRAHTLWCTDTFMAPYGDAVRRAAPDIEVVELVAGRTVSDDDIDRITLAFFSSDAWPERAAPFISVALAAKNLRWLHSMSAGVDNPVFGMFLDRGVRVTTSSGASAEPIAATVMMYLLALSRQLPALSRAQAAHEWAPTLYRELAGMRVAVVGYGPIGEHVVRLATEFGMEPVIIRRRARGGEPCPVLPLHDLVAGVAGVDAVVVALPLVGDTRGIVSADVLAAMRPGSLFVNVGRGELVDQVALTAALRSGHLGGAGLDVFDPEPLAADDPLWDLPNVIVTPHNSGNSAGTADRVCQLFIDNLTRYLADEPLLHEVSSNGAI